MNTYIIYKKVSKLKTLPKLANETVLEFIGSALRQANGYLGGLGGDTFLHDGEGSGERCELVLAYLRALVPFLWDCISLWDR